MPKYKERVFKAKELIDSKPPIIKIGSNTYLYVSTNVVTNVVTLKNVATGERGEMDFYQLKDILNERKVIS